MELQKDHSSKRVYQRGYEFHETKIFLARVPGGALHGFEQAGADVEFLSSDKIFYLAINTAGHFCWLFVHRRVIKRMDIVFLKGRVGWFTIDDLGESLFGNSGVQDEFEATVDQLKLLRLEVLQTFLEKQVVFREEKETGNHFANDESGDIANACEVLGPALSTQTLWK